LYPLQVLSVSKLPGSIGGVKASKDGKLLVAITTSGVYGLDAAVSRVLWHDAFADAGFRLCPIVGSTATTDKCQVAVAADGTSAVFLGGPGDFHWHSYVLSPTGQRVANSSYGKNHFNSLAIDSVTRTWMRSGFFEDHLPSHLPVQVCSVFSTPYTTSHSHNHSTVAAGFAMYDCSGKLLADSQADTRVSSIAVLDDGQLYFAGRATGGNSIFRYTAHGLDKPAPNVESDPYNTPYNLGGPIVSYVAVVDAASGVINRGTFTLTREPNGKGSTFETRELAIDATGNVYIAANAADSIANVSRVTVNGHHTCMEGASLLVLTPDLRTRRTWVLFCKQNGPGGGSAVGVASRGDLVAYLAVTSPGDGMITVNPLPGTAAPGTSLNRGGGYLVVLPSIATADPA